MINVIKPLRVFSIIWDFYRMVKRGFDANALSGFLRFCITKKLKNRKRVYGVGPYISNPDFPPPYPFLLMTNLFHNSPHPLQVAIFILNWATFRL